jgi:hypothetical protein
MKCSPDYMTQKIGRNQVLSSDINGSSRGKKMWVILKEAVI